MVYKKVQYNIETLQNESTEFLYQQRLNNKLNRNEFTDTEEMYNYLKNCIHEAAKKALGEKEDNKGRKTIFWDSTQPIQKSVLHVILSHFYKPPTVTS